MVVCIIPESVFPELFGSKLPLEFRGNLPVGPFVGFFLVERSVQSGRKVMSPAEY